MALANGWPHRVSTPQDELTGHRQDICRVRELSPNTEALEALAAAAVTHLASPAETRGGIRQEDPRMNLMARTPVRTGATGKCGFSAVSSRNTPSVKSTKKSWAPPVLLNNSSYPVFPRSTPRPNNVESPPCPVWNLRCWIMNFWQRLLALGASSGHPHHPHQLQRLRQDCRGPNPVDRP